MLPDGYSDCGICSTPTYGDLCNGCDREIERAAERLGAKYTESRYHKAWGTQVCLDWGERERTKGKHRFVWMAHWTPVVWARKLDSPGTETER